MPKNNETTTKFRVDISDLKSAMQEARKQVAYANSEFKATSSTMDDWSKSSDGISAKLKQLNSNLKSQEAVLAQYEKTLEEVKKEYGENSKEALDYGTKLNNQKSVVNNIKKEISHYEDALQEVSEAERKAAEGGDDLSDSLEDVAEESKDAGDGFTVLKGAVATFAGNALTSLVSGLKDAIGSLINLSSETREYREDINKLETAFTTAGFTTEEATKVYKDFYAVLGEEDRSVEAVNHLAKLVDSEKDLQTWTDICTGVWATFGDSLPIEGLTEASNETAKTGKLTGVLADALNWAGVNEDEFQAKLDGLNGEQERAAYITDVLNGLYSDTADTYRENNKSVMDANKAQSDYTDTLATMGEKVEPVMTTVKQGVTGLLQEFVKLFEGIDIESFTAKIESGFTFLKDTVFPAIVSVVGWFLENKDLIIAGIVAIGAGFVTWNVVSMITNVITAIKGVESAVVLLKGAMALLGGPVTIIITIIASLVAGFITLWNTSDKFRNFWINLWNNIKSVISTAMESIGKFFTETFPEFINQGITFLSQLPSKVWTWLVNTINKVTTWSGNMTSKASSAGQSFINSVINFVSQLPSKVWTWLSDVLSKISSWGSNMASKGRQAAQQLVNSVVEKVSEIPSKVVSIGSDIVSGLWNGIGDKVGWLKDKIRGFVGDVTGWLKKFFKIGSPSKLMADEIGKWIPAGIAVGIDKNAKTALNSIKNLTVDTVDSARYGLKSTTTTLNGRSVSGGVVNNFYQTINSPKQLSRLDIYRQSKNLLGFAGGGY